MDNATVATLTRLNRRFYDTFSEAFSASRSASEPGLERIVSRVVPGDRVLDLGCGQARLALLLPPGCSYTGIDSAPGMLRVARAALEASEGGLVTNVFRADLVADSWEAEIGESYDWIVMRAVLHHIPGYQNRRDLLVRAAKLLAPGGCLALANWQFMRIERLRRRIQPWTKVGLTDADVEPGDYLLDWRRQGEGLRYAHLIDEEETRRLAEQVGLGIDDLFHADGHSDDLTLYAILYRP